MIHITVDFVVAMIAIVIGFIKGVHKREGFIKFLPIFLLLTLCVEFTGQIMQAYYINNVIVYNIFTTFQFTFYIYIFREAIPGVNKKLINRLMWGFPILCLLNIFLLQGPKAFHTYTFNLGCVLMITLGVVYFYRLFKSSEHVILLREPAFWIIISIVFLFTYAIAFLGIANYISELPFSLRYNLRKILKLVNAFTYLFFIIAFLCRSKNIRKSSSSS